MSVERINFLYRKQQTEGLTEEEKAEQQKLRKEYLENFKKNFRAQLDNTYIVDKDGNKSPLKKN